jgi:hypothetical protein
MKKTLGFLTVFIMVLLFISGSENQMKVVEISKLRNNSKDIHTAESGKVNLDLDFGKFPLYFIFNKGQVNQKAQFYAKASRYTLWLTKEGLVFDSVKKKPVKAEAKEKFHISRHLSEHSKYDRDVSRLMFIGANKEPEIVPVKETALKVNYFKGNDRSKWNCDVPTSQAVLYKNLYKNIDLKVYGIEKQIEYDWIIKPGGNPEDIIVEYKNVKGTRIDEEGNLLIETDFGELIHKRPVSYQQKDNIKYEVNAEFKKIKEHTYGFEVGKYDKNRTLIIDPVVLAYSSYLGGEGGDYGIGIAVDNSSNAYVTGYTFSTGFPTLNPYQIDQGFVDVFVTKIDTTKKGISSLVYSSYLGGGDYDTGTGVAVDNNGHAYVTGYTHSDDFPTLNPYQTDQGLADVFVTKIDTTKSGISSLIYSTYLGGTKREMARGIAADSSGHAYVAGVTHSDNFPTLNAYMASRGSITYRCAFVTKLDTTKSGVSSLIYSTYLGGELGAEGNGIDIDSNGNAYVTGTTRSDDFPTLNEYMTYNLHTSVSQDVFVTKIDTTKIGTSSLIYSTYLGGKFEDVGLGIAVDNSGNAYVTGNTNSIDFPVFRFFQDYPAFGMIGMPSAFVSRIDTTKSGSSSLIYSTYLSGMGDDFGCEIAADNNGNAYVTGYTNSEDFPILNEFQLLKGSAFASDAFITKIDTNQEGMSSLIYSTFLGGTNAERGYDIAIDSNGNAYVTGFTKSVDFPTLNQYSNGPSDRWDCYAFITKISAIAPIIPPAVATKTVTNITSTSASCGGNVTNNGGAAVTVRGVCWSISTNPRTTDNYTTEGSGTGKFTSSLTGLTPNTTYYVRAYARNSKGTAYGNEVTFTTPEASAIPGTITITYPQDGDSVSGALIINAQASVNDSNAANSSAQPVTKVEFHIDGVLEKQDSRAPYQHRWDTTLIPNGSHTIKAKAFYANGSTAQHEIAVTVNNATGPPYISLNRTRLNFGVVIGESQTGPQVFLIENSGGCCLNWTISTSEPWIETTPLNGTANMLVSVSVNVNSLSAGSYQGTVTASDVNADNSPASVDIYLEVKKKAQELPPFGSFNSPMDGADVYSTVPVAGWALDDIEVSNVKIYRNPVPGHETGLVYIGDAVFVEGARPDAEEKYPGYPKNYSAGWGYQMLTHFLPNGGNGVYVIYAIAEDSSGNKVTLGTKTINCDNEHAVKPFGAIDTPEQGGIASGMDFVNFGWALTPLPNTIPSDGSTIKVWVDGVPLAVHPVYNLYRKDIAESFPNYNNSNGAIGYYYLDTTLYANGVHTISWSVTDDAGNSDGVGSRYFRILNVESLSTLSSSPSVFLNNVSIPDLPVSGAAVYLKKGYQTGIKQKTLTHPIFPAKDGLITIEIKENERLEVHLGNKVSGANFALPLAGFLVVRDKIKPLPVGSMYDASTGTFYWQPGEGFIGKYRFVFIEKGKDGLYRKRNLEVVLSPKF